MGIRKIYLDIKVMEENKYLLDEFIEWARECGEESWYIFDNTEKAIAEFLKQREL